MSFLVIALLVVPWFGWGICVAGWWRAINLAEDSLKGWTAANEDHAETVAKFTSAQTIEDVYDYLDQQGGTQ